MVTGQNDKDHHDAEAKEFYEMQQQMHLQGSSNMRSIGQPAPAPRIMPMHGPPPGHQPSMVPNMHLAASVHHPQHHPQSHQPMSPQRAAKHQPHSSSNGNNIPPTSQPNPHYPHPHPHQSNGETRPSVIESNQPLIIECT